MQKRKGRSCSHTEGVVQLVQVSVARQEELESDFPKAQVRSLSGHRDECG